jgi:hypothetical protein
MKTKLQRAVDFARDMITPRAIDNIECNVGDKLTIDIILESPVGILGYQFRLMLSGLRFDSHAFSNAFGGVQTARAFNFNDPGWFATETIMDRSQFQAGSFQAVVMQIQCSAVAAGVGIATLTEVGVATVKAGQNIEMQTEVEANQAVITALPDVDVCKITVKIKKVL